MGFSWLVQWRSTGGLYFLFALLGSYLFPAVFVNYSVERVWTAAYDVSTLVELMTDSTYLIGYLIYLIIINGIGLIVVGILMILSLLTIIGWIIIWPIIFFYWYAIDAALWGRVYYNILGEGNEEEEVPAVGV